MLDTAGYAYVSGLGPDWLATDSEPDVSYLDYESQSEREERQATELGNHDPSHACGWEEFCTRRVQT